MTRESNIVKSPSGRPTRTPVGRKNVLTVKGKEPGFEYRVVNDTGDRVESFKEGGWEVVSNDQVNVGDKRVNKTSSIGSAATQSVGNGTQGVVMRIKQEWYDEDQAAKQAQVDELEGTTRRDALNGADYGKLSIKRGS